jgi:hypothetical protein
LEGIDALSDIIRSDEDEVIQEQEIKDEWEEVPIVDEPDDEGEDQLIKEWDEEE